MNTSELQGWRGRELVDPQGDKIGTIDDIYLDDQTGQPEWLAVRTGMFGMRQSFVPVAGASVQGEYVVSRWTRPRSRTRPTPTPTAPSPRRRSSASTTTTAWPTPRPGPTPGFPRGVPAPPPGTTPRSATTPAVRPPTRP